MLNKLRMLRSQQRMGEARKEYKKPLKINRESTQKNTQTRLPGVAMMLSNLQMLPSQQRRMGQARKEYKVALKINRKLTQKNTQTRLPGVAMMLNNLRKLDNMQRRLTCNEAEV